MELSVIIVHYHTPELLEKCLKSIFDQNLDYVEVIVVNNGSEIDLKPKITKTFKETIWIDAGYNSGFARANNLGIKKSNGEYVFLLNSDAYVDDKTLPNLLKSYKQNDINNDLGLLGCRVVSSKNGDLQVGSGRGFLSNTQLFQENPLIYFFAKLFKTTYQKPAYNPSEMHYKNHELDYLSGSCVMIKRDKVKDHNLYLDEDFFLYYEDVEWSHRVKKLGFKNFFCAEAQIYHVNSASTGKSNTRTNQIITSKWLYILKTRGKLLYFFILLNYYIGTFILRLVIFKNKLIKKQNAEEFKEYNRKTAEKNVMNQYAWKILFKYKKDPSASDKYLKYD